MDDWETIARDERSKRRIIRLATAHCQPTKLPLDLRGRSLRTISEGGGKRPREGFLDRQTHTGHDSEASLLTITCIDTASSFSAPAEIDSSSDSCSRSGRSSRPFHLVLDFWQRNAVHSLACEAGEVDTSPVRLVVTEIWMSPLGTGWGVATGGGSSLSDKRVLTRVDVMLTVMLVCLDGCV